MLDVDHGGAHGQRGASTHGTEDRAPGTAGGARAGEGGPGLPVLCLMAALAAGLTVWLQGFVFGWSNNIFQVPFVEGWFDEPAFANDAFVQALRYFVSWVWPFAARLAPLLGTESTFLALHAASRFLMMLAAALLIRHLGLRAS